MQYGATYEEWEAWESLQLRDLLPSVCDPNVQISPRSELKPHTLKVPTVINSEGHLQGIKGWTKKITTSVHDWMADPRLGISLITRTFHAFDIDIDDAEVADEVEALITAFTGPLPTRTRCNSPRRAMLYRISDPPENGLSKKVLKIGESGVIEMLFAKQQILVAGTHKSGVRYEWREGIPRSLDEIPSLTVAQLSTLVGLVHGAFGKGAVDNSLEAESGLVANRSTSQVDYANDPIVQFLEEKDWITQYATDGAIYVRCPWEAWHGTEESHPSQTCFFPQGLGNHTAHPGFKCMHGHSLAPEEANLNFTHQRFLSEIGYTATEFPVMAKSDRQPAPKFTRKGKTATIEATLPNVVNMFEWPDGFNHTFCYDSFKDIIAFKNGESKWNLLDDDTYTLLRLKLATSGFEPTVSKDMVRDAVSFVARNNPIDSAQEWLNALQWDGVSRLHRFHVDALLLPDTEFHHAVSMYLWTALAGRVLEPGCKADMVPILIGSQGMRKSTFVEKLAPNEEMFVAVSLGDRDDNLSRITRGKLVAEWDELRGLQSKDEEAIKGWVTRRFDEWIPKFKEFSTSQARRFIVLGTSNPAQILNDPTGNRRWLPLFLERPLDIDYLVSHRNQLWAEARETFKRTGVQWQRAELLSKDAQRKASVRDVWVDPVYNWLETQCFKDGWSASEILHAALDVQRQNQTRASQERLRRVMVYLGWEEKDGKWYCNFV